MASVNNPSPRQTKILLVDDREDNLLSIEAILAPDGYQFYKAYSGEQALKILLNEFDFAMILMDVKMPVLSGFETATLIHERERLRNIPIVFITANNYGDENIFKGYKAGGIDYIFKPINPEVLRAKVAVFVDIYKKNSLLLEQEQYLSTANKNLEKEINDLRAAKERTRQLNVQLQKEFSELASVLLSSKWAEDCFVFEQCDLHELLKSFLVDMDGEVQEKLATVEIGPLPSLKVSRLLMRPLFESLIRNALSYSKENVRPFIKIRSEIDTPVSVTSKNNLDTKYCHIILEDNNGNSKNHSHERSIEESDIEHGKDLVFCKKIMDKHNGFIVARSKTETGSATTVSFPLTN